VSDIAALKSKAAAAIDAAAPRLFEVSENLHANVELFFEEFKGQRWLCDLLMETGFNVEEGLGSLPTAFRGMVKSAKPGPRIAFLSEYDGLPIYGHSCGHNVGGPASVGAAIGLKAVIEEIGGEVISLGTPGEEGGSGKHVMHREGFFDGIDAMMLIYPGRDNIAHSRALTATHVHFEYFGHAAHGAARPELGINALDAMNLACTGVAFLRQQTPSDVRIHYIIIKGGTLANVVPDHTTATLMIRANENATLDMMIPRIDAILEGAAMMTGARLQKKWREGSRGRPLLSNYAMSDIFDRNMRALGRETKSRDELSGAWGGDTSNVSWFVPTIQPQIAMTEHPPHSHEFHNASVGPAARSTLIDAAKAMAMTAIDLIAAPGELDAVKKEFAANSLI
jgi:amidohydrolase